jgi:hypothetical protein
VVDVVEPGAPENAPKGSFGAGARLDPLTKPSRTDRGAKREASAEENQAILAIRGNGGRFGFSFDRAKLRPIRIYTILHRNF